jgi:hydroxymethylpyrimidine/phosphomethylpyrimidine kinase
MTPTSRNTSIPVVLTIAGSDSSGGAGIQADIKTISATGSYACSVITAITAQNTLGVHDVFPIPLIHITSQLDAVFQDLNIVAVKIGMLANSDIIDIVANKLEQYRPPYVVLDPVIAATSGETLLEESALNHLKMRLLPRVSLITPNRLEAAILTGIHASTDQDVLQQMCSALRQLNTAAVLLKGGHSESKSHSDDILITPTATQVMSAERINTLNTHGTGCTLSSAIASYLAQGHSLSSAVKNAKLYISQTITHADLLHVGKGNGPVHHFFSMKR